MTCTKVDFGKTQVPFGIRNDRYSKLLELLPDYISEKKIFYMHRDVKMEDLCVIQDVRGIDYSIDVSFFENSEKLKIEESHPRSHSWMKNNDNEENGP